MLKQSQTNIEENPFDQLLQQGIEAVVIYQKQKPQNYKSRGQRNKEKIQRITNKLVDPDLKKQMKMEQRHAEKIKLHKIIDAMTEEEARRYLDQKKQKRKQQKIKVREAMKTGQIIMLDLVFEDKMNQKQNKSLGKQIQLIIKTIKMVQQPPSIHLCSLGGAIKKHLQKMNYQFWAVTPHDENVKDMGQILNKKLIYLSPDAELPLDKIEPDTAFILGGLIDRSIIKNASFYRAKQLGIEARKLPISQYMTGRSCLNLDHVVAMICKFKENNDWKEAFQYACPKRWKKSAGEMQLDIFEQRQSESDQDEKQEKEQK